MKSQFSQNLQIIEKHSQQFLKTHPDFLSCLSEEFNFKHVSSLIKILTAYMDKIQKSSPVGLFEWLWVIVSEKGRVVRELPRPFDPVLHHHLRPVPAKPPPRDSEHFRWRPFPIRWGKWFNFYWWRNKRTWQTRNCCKTPRRRRSCCNRSTTISSEYLNINIVKLLHSFPVRRKADPPDLLDLLVLLDHSVPKTLDLAEQQLQTQPRWRLTTY